LSETIRSEARRCESHRQVVVRQDGAWLLLSHAARGARNNHDDRLRHEKKRTSPRGMPATSTRQRLTAPGPPPGSAKWRGRESSPLRAVRLTFPAAPAASGVESASLVTVRGPPAPGFRGSRPRSMFGEVFYVVAPQAPHYRAPDHQRQRDRYRGSIGSSAVAAAGRDGDGLQACPARKRRKFRRRR
jgi:hypothetical protein